MLFNAIIILGKCWIILFPRISRGRLYRILYNLDTRQIRQLSCVVSKTIKHFTGVNSPIYAIFTEAFDRLCYSKLFHINLSGLAMCPLIRKLLFNL